MKRISLILRSRVRLRNHDSRIEVTTLEHTTSPRGERKRGRPTAAERVQRRAHILDTALPVFLESGYGESTIDRLAAAAQVTKRTIYSYFGSKDGVFIEMQRRLAENVSGDTGDELSLESLSIRIVHRLHSTEMIGLHRLVIAESLRFPELARLLYENGDMRHVSRLENRLRAESRDELVGLAEPLYALLLGENYRRRLLGLLPPATYDQARDQARSTLELLGLDIPAG